MNKTYQSAITSIINRIYKRNGQETTRAILKKHFTQNTKQKRLTLEELGKLNELEAPVTRERARQIIEKFIAQDLPKDHSHLKSAIINNDHLTLSQKNDLAELEIALRRTIEVISEFERPIFAKHIQQRLIAEETISEPVHLPILLDIARALEIEANFKIIDFQGEYIFPTETHSTAELTRDIISYAGKISTHFCGIFRIDTISDPTWNESSPKALRDIPPSTRQQYVADLLSNQADYIEIKNGFYSFTSRDERISNILKPIFYAYHDPVPVEKLVPAIQRALTQNFKKKKDSKQETFLSVLASSSEAIDDFCLKTGLLDDSTPQKRGPGTRLKKMLDGIDFSQNESVSYQLRALQKIREHGKAVESMEFGRILNEDICLPEPYRGLIYSYATLYYKDGGGRRNDFYKPLDDKYSAATNKAKQLTHQSESKLTSIAARLIKLINEFESFDKETDALAKSRAEQALLRRYLIIKDQQLCTEGNKGIGRCQICKKTYPLQLLIAAHIKPRSKCSHEERIDFENIAMLQCATCDSLFENGFISINSLGEIIVSRSSNCTNHLELLYKEIEGIDSNYLNGIPSRESYCSYHRNNIFQSHR